MPWDGSVTHLSSLLTFLDVLFIMDFAFIWIFSNCLLTIYFLTESLSSTLDFVLTDAQNERRKGLCSLQLLLVLEAWPWEVLNASNPEHLIPRGISGKD